MSPGTRFSTSLIPDSSVQPGVRPPGRARYAHPGGAPAPAPRDREPLTAEQPSPNRDRLPTWIAHAAVIAVVLTCLVITFGPHRIGDYATETDFYGGYARGAEQLLRHGIFDPTRYSVVGPGYEVMLALAAAIVGNTFVAAQLLSTLAAAVTLLAWFHLLRGRVGAYVAMACTLILATNPTLLRYGYSATTDAVALALQAAALYLMFSARGSSRMWLAGLVTACACLTRYTAVYLLPAGVLASLFDATGASRTRRLLVFLAGAGVPIAAWFAVLYQYGVATHFRLYHLIAAEAFARSRGLTLDDYERTIEPTIRSFADVWRHDSTQLVRQWLANLWGHAGQDVTRLLGLPIAVAAVAGAVVSARTGSLRRVWPLAVAGLVAYLSLVPVAYTERYSLMLLPMYAMFGGLGLWGVPWPWRVGRIRLQPVLLVVCLLFPLVDSVTLQTVEMKSLPTDVLTASRTLRVLGRPGERVISRKPHLSYLAGLEMLPFPYNDTFSGLVDYARERHARWLYVSAAEAISRPANLPLLDTTGVIPGLTPRCVVGTPPAVLYEIDPALGRRPTWAADSALIALRLARANLRLETGNVTDMWVVALLELDRGMWSEARETLRAASRVDERADPPLAAVAARDSTRAVRMLLALLR
jgi:4-amino-4-deoxy-L-arabinose transferase-like glycosyltransferase